MEVSRTSLTNSRISASIHSERLGEGRAEDHLRGRPSGERLRTGHSPLVSGERPVVTVGEDGRGEGREDDGGVSEDREAPVEGGGGGRQGQHG